MNSKKDAEITEKELLDKFDYAWNKGSNGLRRQDDIHKKLKRLEKASEFSLLAKKFLFSNQREVGIKIRTGSNVSEMDNNTIFSRIIGVRRLQARPVQYGSSDCGNNICGVAIGHGSVCTTPPVAGRKRCAMHKGQRVNGYISKLNTEGKAAPPDVETDVIQQFSDKDFNLHCGFILEDGSSCKSSPVQGNKRCLEHKGRRIRRSNPRLQGKNPEKFMHAQK